MSQSAKRRTNQRAPIITAMLGIALTLLILILDWVGAMAPLERWCFAKRAAWCQRHVPAPTRQLVHVDINDDSIEKIGRWPWERWKLAWIIDELRIAGAQVIAMDILFIEPQHFAKPGQPAPSPEEVSAFDAELAAAIKRHGNVIVALDPSLSEPIKVIRDAAADMGMVAYPLAPDGVSRFVSLRARNGNQQHTHLALLLAARYMGAKSNDIIDGDSQLAFNTPGGQIVVPVHDLPALASENEQNLYADMYIPWFGATGKNGWETMFDWPEHRNREVGHVSVFDVWNSAGDDPALRRISADYYRKFTIDGGPQLPAKPDRAQREAFINSLFQKVNEMFADYQGDDLTAEDRDQLADLVNYKATLEVLRENTGYIEEKRAWLRERIDGKAVLIGFTATALTDQTTTPLHPTAPGVMVHGAIFNGILTGEYWHAPANQYTLIITLALGILTACMTALRGPLLATLAAAVFVTSYVLINGYILFDAYNLILGVSSPVTAVVVVWAGCTVARFVIERLERARVEKRFRSYVDPMLVDYVIEHPEKTRLDGERRELTVVFTDLAGFTTLSERLREKVVPLLSEYFERMVPIIRENNGYVNKFLGDGMMFFHGAPVENEGHAIHAVVTAVRMGESLLEFNEILAERGLPLLGMRAGIATGPMTVGDAGPADASDYTVIGDAVNFASRLEGANKATDTKILINNRTAELVDEHFLLRPIGNLQVVGKTEGVFVYEPLCRIDQAEDDQKQLVDDTLEMVNAFVAGTFTACVEKLDAFEEKYGRDKLTLLYREYCEQFIENPPGDEFTGRIVLTEK